MQTKRQPNFLYLLAGLLVILVASPVVYEFTNQPIPLVSQIAFTVLLFLGLWSLIEDRRWFIMGIALVVADTVMTAYHLVTGSVAAEVTTILLEMTFCALSLGFALDHVLFGTSMSFNRIIGAICVYLLLGLIFGQTNMLIYKFLPNSFNGIDNTEVAMEGFTLLYYTFVTMTTLGYGDVSPEGPLARVIAYLAAIAGQFYIAILVAMLVSQYINQLNQQKQKTDD